MPPIPTSLRISSVYTYVTYLRHSVESSCTVWKASKAARKLSVSIQVFWILVSDLLRGFHKNGCPNSLPKPGL